MRESDGTVLAHDLVLLGGGHAHALVLDSFAMEPLKGVALTLISPDPTTPYTGMLPGHIAGHYRRDEIEIDLVRLARRAGARLILERAVAIDRARQVVRTAGGREIAYDLLSIDIGATAPIPALPGAELAHAVRPLAGFADAFAALLESVSPGDAIDLAVIGAGLGGVEIALAMEHVLRTKGARPQVSLIDRSEAFATQVPSLQKRLRREIAKAGIVLVEGAEVLEITPSHVRTSKGEVPSRFSVFASGVVAHPWLKDLGLALTNGFVNVTPSLQSPDDPRIFAAGDCAHLTHAPRPKAGVFAVRQARTLAANLRACLTGGRLQAYQPQGDYLKLVSLGGQRALANRGPLSMGGAWAWQWKDRIDRAFMAKFAPPIWSGAPDDILCAGCGSKVGRGVLSRVIGGDGDDAAVVRTGGVDQILTTDHLRAFTDDVALMARAATVHALGDIWAMGARADSALLSVILPRMSETLQERRLAEIGAAVRAVLAEEGAHLVGGHTTQGAELVIGLTLTGHAETTPLRLAGAQAGDALILTKPIGVGVLLAAEMRGLARGADIAALVAMMVKPQGRVASLLAPHAHAMTDVTGFGLAGHLGAMMTASQKGARIVLDHVPVAPGAEELAARGMRSSLFGVNLRDASLSGPASARFDLLFDPQTCGGLLAAVRGDQADGLVAELRLMGFPAARIGEVTADPAITAI